MWDWLAGIHGKGVMSAWCPGPGRSGTGASFVAGGRVLAVVLLATMSVAGGCRPSAGRGEPVPQSVLIGPEDFVVAEQGTLDGGPLLSGSLQPRSRATLVAQTGGSVEQVLVELSDRVKAGQLLVRVQARELQDATSSARTALNAAEQAYELTRRQLDRTRQLVSGGALAENELELAENEAAAAEARRDQARAALVSAQERLGTAHVRAPFAGVVSERNVSLGDVVAPGSPLLTIIDPSSMRLEASVPSHALESLAVGQGVEFHVRGMGDQSFRGEIERIGPAADPITRQIPLLITLPNPSGRLVAGLFVEGYVALREETGVIVPSTALDDAQGRASVRRLQSDRVEVVNVTVGVRDAAGERVLVTSGLSPGDRVLTGAAKALPAGTAVEMRERPPEPAG
jgi:RND family efflux transporter MFP subunit